MTVLINMIFSLPSMIMPIRIPINKKNGIIVEGSLLNNENSIIIIAEIIILFIFIVSSILILSPNIINTKKRL